MGDIRCELKLMDYNRTIMRGNKSNPLEILRPLISHSENWFLGRFATTALLADALGPWDQGTSIFVAWLLSPTFAFQLDNALVLHVCKSLSVSERRRLLRFSALPHLRPQTFFRVLRLIQSAMLSAEARVNNEDVESLSRTMLRFAQHHPRVLHRLDSSHFHKIVERYSTGGRRSLQVACLQIVFGVRIKENLKQLMAMHSDEKALRSIVDALCIPFKGRPHVLDMIRNERHGKLVLTELAKVQTAWKRYRSPSTHAGR